MHKIVEPMVDVNIDFASGISRYFLCQFLLSWLLVVGFFDQHEIFLIPESKGFGYLTLFAGTAFAPGYSVIALF